MLIGAVVLSMIVCVHCKVLIPKISTVLTAPRDPKYWSWLPPQNVAQVSQLLVLLSWSLLTWLLRTPGLLKLYVNASLIVALVAFVWSHLVPGTIPALLVLSSLCCAKAMDLRFPYFVFVGMLYGVATALYWRRRSRLASTVPELPLHSPLAQGFQLLPDLTTPYAISLLMIPGVLITALVIVWWVMVSMNYFWMYNEQSKFKMLDRFQPGISLGAMRVDGVLDLEPLRGTPGNHSSFTPVVIKPSVCTTSARGAKICRTFSCLEEYIAAGKAANRKGSWVPQQLQQGQEAVVFFYKFPYASRGHIKTIGVRDPARLEETEIGEKLHPNYFTKPADHLITPVITEFFNNMADRIPGYHGGRFDVMLRDPVEASLAGKGIFLMDSNLFPLGCLSEKEWTDTPWRTFDQGVRTARTYAMQAWIGLTVILGGYNDDFILFLTSVPRLVERCYECENWEHLIAKP